jgi:hypothetical protein
LQHITAGEQFAGGELDASDQQRIEDMGEAFDARRRAVLDSDRYAVPLGEHG